MRSCSPLSATTTRGPSSTRKPRRDFATRRARPAIPRACCSATARRCCTRWPSALPDAKGHSAQSVVLPIVPMFHVNAWGIPYSAPLVGAKIVFPGAGLDGKSLYELFESERVAIVGRRSDRLARPDSVHEAERSQVLDLQTDDDRRLGLPAGDDADAARRFRRQRRARLGHDRDEPGRARSAARKPSTPTCRPTSGLALSLKQGRPLYGVEMKIVDAEGRELPHDGIATGNVMVKGPWVLRDYFNSDEPSPLSADGWFPTGDVGSIDADGYLQITDRSKDVIKSGGEWISSIELENVAIGHPGGARSRGHRRVSSEMERAPSSARGQEAGRESQPRRDAPVLRGQDRQVVDARRRRVRRRAAAYGDRQAVEESAARKLQGIPSADLPEHLVRFALSPAAPTSLDDAFRRVCASTDGICDIRSAVDPLFEAQHGDNPP